MMPPHDTERDEITSHDALDADTVTDAPDSCGGHAVAPAEHTTRVLRLTVRNHPGVLSHVSGLFARRAFNVEAILCLPLGDATRSAILLVVRADGRLEQLVRQLAKLEDVVDVRPDPDGRRALVAAAAMLA
jgi:acetolactate synthase I/III small subunit